MRHHRQPLLKVRPQRVHNRQRQAQPQFAIGEPVAGHGAVAGRARRQLQAAIAQALARLRGKRTLIVIAHQLSTVAMADQIVVLEYGQIIEQGPPAQLRESQGRYAHFLNQRHAAKGWRIATAAQDNGV